MPREACGIGAALAPALEDWPPVERASFLHFVTLARRCGDPQDPALFTDQLRAALTAAFALDGLHWVLFSS